MGSGDSDKSFARVGGQRFFWGSRYNEKKSKQKSKQQFTFQAKVIIKSLPTPTSVFQAKIQ